MNDPGRKQPDRNDSSHHASLAHAADGPGGPARIRLSSERLAVLFIAVFAAGVTLVLTSVYYLSAKVVDREVDAVISAEVAHLVDDYSRGGLLQLVSTLRSRTDSWGRFGAVYLLTEANGQPIAGNLARWPSNVRSYNNWIEFEIDASEAGGVVAHPVRAQRFLLPGGRRLLVGTDILERTRLASSLRTAMFWGVGSIILLATLFGISYSRGIRRRVRAFATTCESIMAGDLSQRLPVQTSHDEFDTLATAVNRMLERIEQQTSVLRTTFDSAAHDLRGPLYRARVRIEETLQHPGLADGSRETMEATLAELERVQRTLGTLLQIAQADGGGRDLPTQEVDLAQLARELVELYTPEAGARDVSLEYDGVEHMTIRGNSQLLAQALVNLIENAIKYVAPGGRIDVRVTSGAQAASLIVADNGPGIPAHERSRILQPFVRLERDRERVGSGLGLSLVAAVMRMHRASIELLDNQPGLIVRCTLPR